MHPRLRLLPGMVIVAAGTTAAAAAADVPYPDGGAQVRAAADVDGVAAAAHDAFPTSLWYDPAEAATVAHVMEQVDLLLGGGNVDSASAIKGLHAIAAAIHAAGAQDPDPQEARWTVVARHDDATGVAAALSTRLPLPMDGVGAPMIADVGGFHGVAQWHWFCGSASAGVGGPGMCAVGDRLAMQTWVADTADSATKPVVTPPAAPVWMTVDFAPTLALVSDLATDGVSFGLDPLLPKWHADPHASLALGVTPADGGWKGTIDFTAQALPLHAIAADVAALGRKHQITMAMGIDPHALMGLIVNQLSVAEERQFDAMIGAPAEDAGAVFSGDIMVMADVTGLVPQGALVFAVRPGRSPAGVVAALVKSWNGAPVPNAGNTFQLQTPVGPLLIAYNDQRVVVGDDPDLGAALLAGTAGDAPIPAGKALYADVDVPGIAKLWLPLAWKMLGDRSIPLAPEPLPALAFRLPESALALAQTRGEAADFAQLLDDKLPPLVLTRDGGSLPWKVETGFLRQHLQHLLPPGPSLGVTLDQSIALYGAPAAGAGPGALPTTSATVLRLADGWHVIEDDRRGHGGPLDAAGIQARLKAMKHLLGPEAAALPVLTPAGVPVFDRTWLPALAHVLPGLKTWHVEGTVDANGGKAEETGEPFATVALGIACASMVLNDQPHLLHYHLRAVEERNKPPAEQPLPPEPHRVEL